MLAYGLRPAGSNSPSRKRIDSTFRTAPSTSAMVIRPCASADLIAVVVGAEFWLSSVKLSSPARTAAALPSALVA